MALLRLVVVWAFLAFIGGCLSPGEAGPPPTLEEPATPPPKIPIDEPCLDCNAPKSEPSPRPLVIGTGYACQSTCFEPTVAIDGAGRIMVSRGYTPNSIRVSEDGGSTWIDRDRPPAPPGRGPTTVFNQGDILLQTAPDGSVYYSLLYIDFFEPAIGTTLILDGLQVAATRDGGQTWFLNKYISVRDGPGQLQALNPDRQWLGFGEKSIYLSVSFFSPVVATSIAPPFGIYAARSDDGGATWGAFAPVAMNLDRGIGGGQAGRVVVAHDGTAFLPLRHHGGFLADAYDPSPDYEPAPNALAVAASSDGGQTWSMRGVDAQAVGQGTAIGLPQVAWHSGRLASVWMDTSGSCWLAGSTDAGASWGIATLLADDCIVGPWIEAGPFGWFATWTTGTTDTFDVHLGRVDWENATVSDLVLATGQSGPHGNTDFSHLGLTPVGRPVVVWANSGDDIYVGTYATG